MREQPEFQDKTTYSAGEAFEKIWQVFDENQLTIALDRRDKLFRDGMTSDEVYDALLCIMQRHNIKLSANRAFFEKKVF